MNCQDCRKQLPEYVDGDAAPDLRAALEAHFDTCAGCAAALAGEYKARAQFAALLDPVVQRRRLDPAARARVAAAGRSGAGERPAASWWCARYNLLAAAAALMALISAVSICGYVPKQTLAMSANPPASTPLWSVVDLTNTLSLLDRTGGQNSLAGIQEVNTVKRVSW